MLFGIAPCVTFQVYQLDKRMLDPRRPIGPPSKDDQLEQLIPYQQNLVIIPLLYATHSKQVAQLSGEPSFIHPFTTCLS